MRHRPSDTGGQVRMKGRKVELVLLCSLGHIASTLSFALQSQMIYSFDRQVSTAAQPPRTLGQRSPRHEDLGIIHRIRVRVLNANIVLSDGGRLSPTVSYVVSPELDQ